MSKRRPSLTRAWPASHEAGIDRDPQVAALPEPQETAEEERAGQVETREQPIESRTDPMTAKALGDTIARAVLGRADQGIGQ